MNTFILWLLIGLGIGIPVFFIGLWIVRKIKNVLERRLVKRLLKQGSFLTPIDTKDYNADLWKNKKYGNIDSEKEAELIPKLNQTIFKKIPKEIYTEVEDKGL